MLLSLGGRLGLVSKRKSLPKKYFKSPLIVPFNRLFSRPILHRNYTLRYYNTKTTWIDILEDESEPTFSKINLASLSSKQSELLKKTKNKVVERDLVMKLANLTGQKKEEAAEAVFNEIRQTALGCTHTPKPCPLNLDTRPYRSLESIQSVMELQVERKALQSKNSQILYNLMLAMYLRTDNISKFMGIVDLLKQDNVRPDITMYNLLLALRAKNGQIEKLLQLVFDMVQSNIKMDQTSFNIVIEALGLQGSNQIPKVGQLGGHSGIISANYFWNLMANLNVPKNSTSCDIMFNILFKNGMHQQVVELWDITRHQSGDVSSDVIVLSMISSLKFSKKSAGAKRIWEYCKPSLMRHIEDLEYYNIIDVSKNGDISREPSAEDQERTNNINGIWDDESKTCVPNETVENVVIQILREEEDFVECFSVWASFRRAKVTPLPETCAIIMEIYLHHGDAISGLSVYQWVHYYNIPMSPNILVNYLDLEMMSQLQKGVTKLEEKNVGRTVWQRLTTSYPTYKPLRVSSYENFMMCFHMDGQHQVVIELFNDLFESCKKRISVEQQTENLPFDSVAEPSSYNNGSNIQCHVSIDTLSMVLRSCLQYKRTKLGRSTIANKVETLRESTGLKPTPEFTELFSQSLTSDYIKKIEKPSKGFSIKAISEYLTGKKPTSSAPKFDPLRWNLSPGQQIKSRLREMALDSMTLR